MSYCSLCWPIWGLVALIGAAGLLVLTDFSRQQNRAYADSTRELVTQAMDGLIETNAVYSTDYALWNDAFKNISLNKGPQNLEWLQTNFNPTNAGATGIYRQGVGMTYLFVKPEFELARPDIERYAATSDLSAHDAYKASGNMEDVVIFPKAMTVLGGKLATIAMQPIRPETASNLRKLNPNAPVDFVVFVNFVNASTIESLGRRSAIKNPELHITAVPKSHRSERLGIDIFDASGKALARIDWEDTRPGTKAFLDRLGPMAAILFIMGLVTAAVARQSAARQMKLSEDARKAAEDASKAKSSFLANVSHELRTPLNAIIGYSEILEEDCTFANNQIGASDAKKVSRSAYHLLALINDLLDHSKIEAGKMDLNPSRSAFGPILEDVIDALQVKAQEKANRLLLNCDPDIGEGFVDAMRLKQCLLNLVSNALKFTQNGHVTVSARPVEIDGVPFVRMRVKDTGIGMSAATMAKLFVPFVQADEGTAQKFGGTGLGLVITKRLIEAMGGAISVESIEGSGSIFTLLVPRGAAIGLDALPATTAALAA